MAAQKIAGKKRPSSEPRLTSRQSKIFAAKQAEEKAQAEKERKARLEREKLAKKQNQEAKKYQKRREKEMERRRRLGHLGPLVSTTSGDYTTQTMELTAEFTRRFGEQTPIWFIGSLDEAAKEAYGAQTKTIDRKMLAIYIHNENSISANIFCSQVLCATPIVDFLAENCVSWGFDTTEYENKHKIIGQIDRMFGASLASQLRRMSDDDFPILVLANGKATQNEATEIVKGDNSVDEAMTKLMTSLEISNSRKQDDVQFEMEREARDNEILEQESAYEQSLKADRDRIKKLQEEEEKKRKEEQQKLKEEAENAQKQQEAENSLPPEPPAGNNVCHLRFRFPDGRMAQRRFLLKEKLSVLFLYMGSEGFQEPEHRLLRQFPRADLSALKRSQTLEQLGLKQDNLVIEAQREESEDESDDSDMEE